MKKRATQGVPLFFIDIHFVIMLSLCVFPVPTSAQAGKFIEAIDSEPLAAVEASKVLPPTAAIAVAVALARPTAHIASKRNGRVIQPFLCNEGKGTRSVGEDIASCDGAVAVAQRHVLKSLRLHYGIACIEGFN